MALQARLDDFQLATSSEGPEKRSPVLSLGLYFQERFSVIDSTAEYPLSIFCAERSPGQASVPQSQRRDKPRSDFLR